MSLILAGVVSSPLPFWIQVFSADNPGHLVRWRPFAVPSNHSAVVPIRGDARRLSPRGPHIPREPYGTLPAPVPPVPEAASNTSPENRQGQITTATPPSPLPTTATPKARPARLKRNKAQRHEWRRELQQHLWVLDMEYERRFRAAMNRQMDAMTDWQDANMSVQRRCAC